MEGSNTAVMGEGGEIVVQGVPVSMGREARVTEATACRFFAGWRSEPFYFDGKVTGDNVAPHTDLLEEFPHLGPPHSAMQADWKA